MSVPAGSTREGAPVGLQLVVRPGADAALLALVIAHCPPARTPLAGRAPPAV